MWHGSRIVCHDPTEHESVRVGYVWPLTIQSLYGREPDLAMRCFICGSDEFYLGPSTRSIAKEFTVYRCKNCRVVTTDPMPTDEDLDRFYGSNEAVAFSGFDIRQLIARHEEFINSPTDSVNFLRSSYLEVTRDLPPGAKCLEVGCNLGRLIELLQKHCHFDFYALELNEEAVRFCQDRAKFKIARARLQDNPFPGVVFDVIGLFDVFEHLPRPEEFIGSMAARLRIGGFVILAVPNAASLSANLLTLLKKLKLYDGEDVEGFRQKDVKLIREQAEREGMDGISPRFIINRISTSLIKPDTRCINPIDVLRAIKEGIELQGQLKKADRERYNNLIADARREYDEIARTDVQKAFFVSFEQEAVTLLDNYLDNVEAYLDQTKLTDPITGEEVPPNEKLMRSIEEKVQVPEHGKDSFRNEIFRKVAMAHRRREKFDYTTHEKLKEAIEKQLFEERRDTIKLTIASRSPDTEQLRKLNEVVETLVSREGYCTECANELLKYVSSLLAREK